MNIEKQLEFLCRHLSETMPWLHLLSEKEKIHLIRARREVMKYRYERVYRLYKKFI